MSDFAEVHVLIIENDTSSIDVLTQLLDQLGASYTVLEDGRLVLDVVPQLPRVDVIFLDLEMPQVDGYNVLTAIQNTPELTAVPVVAYSSHVSEMSNARSAGFHSFLGKPLQGKHFSSHFSRILNHQPVWESR